MRGFTLDVSHWMSLLRQLLTAIERISCLHPVAVVARKRLDIAFLHDITGAIHLSIKACLAVDDIDEDRARAVNDVSSIWTSALERQWKSNQVSQERPQNQHDGRAVPFLSVRTAFDLYLKALGLPRGSRIICSALTIPGMVTILEAHGLVPVPVDMDSDTLAPNLASLQSEISRGERHGADETGDNAIGAKAIYIAHVFGAQVDMEPIAKIARQHDLLLWEDCAQVFTGLEGYLGHPQSSASFFSFGVIKRATALGGGVAYIRDNAVLASMESAEANYPAQSAVAYIRRAMKCAMLLACTSPLIYGVLVHLFRLMNIDHDKVIMKLSRGFPKQGFFRAIRHRPSVPLLQMLARRLSQYRSEDVSTRLRRCNRMLRVLDRALQIVQADSEVEKCYRAADVLPGTRAHRHTLWLCPVIVKGGSHRADAMVKELLLDGFDATRAPTSLVPIEKCMSPQDIAAGNALYRMRSSQTSKCSAMMESLVYLPLLDNMPDSEWDRLTLAVARALNRASVPAETLGSSSTFRASTRKMRVTNVGDVFRRAAALLMRLDISLLIVICFLLKLCVV